MHLWDRRIFNAILTKLNIPTAPHICINGNDKDISILQNDNCLHLYDEETRKIVNEIIEDYDLVYQKIVEYDKSSLADASPQEMEGKKEIVF